ncbi:hypothetical protein ES695_11205 [Candidatus Atribacteria bacterium 1244-E10-H5-B2]|nr:MAG: hypothetical protein ES695_11205 [Candidatus Atribacteria bacterium 1244-E10-H5-B2]
MHKVKDKIKNGGGDKFNPNEITRRSNILGEIYKIAKPALDNFYNYGLRESEVITRQKRLDILDNICQALKSL